MTELLAQKILIVQITLLLWQCFGNAFYCCGFDVHDWDAVYIWAMQYKYNLKPMRKKWLNEKIEYNQVVNRNTISNDNDIFFIQLQHVTVINMGFVRSVVFDSSTSHTDNIKCNLLHVYVNESK